MPDEDLHFEIAVLLRAGLERPLSEDEERRLRRLMERESPRASRLHGSDLVRAGLVLAGTWPVSSESASVPSG